MLRTVLRMSQRKWRAGVARGEKVAVSGKAGLATLDKELVFKTKYMSGVPTLNERTVGKNVSLGLKIEL